jgi:hypothetical protein
MKLALAAAAVAGLVPAGSATGATHAVAQGAVVSTMFARRPENLLVTGEGYAIAHRHDPRPRSDLRRHRQRLSSGS